MAGDSVTVLSHPVALATKRHVWTGSRWKTEPYGDGKYFAAESVPVGGLADLYALLQVLADDPRAFVIRAEPIPGRDLTRIRRTKKMNSGEPAGFREAPRRWMMVDVDGLDYEPEWGTKAGCQAAADYLLGMLPMELRTAGYIWQASASAGIKPGLRMHLWFWLDRPLGEVELTRWGDNVNDLAGTKIIDVAPFRTVQPNYTANPVIEGQLDAVVQRLGYVPGGPASLPRLSARADQWKQKLQPLYYELNDKIHDHVRDACASYFCAHGPDAEATPLRNALKAAVARALEIQERDDYPDDRLEAEIESGKSFARDRAAGGDNLLLDNSGRPKGCIANVLAVMQSHADWRGMLSWNERAGVVEILQPTPWGSSPREWIDSIDSVQAAQWLAKEKNMATDDGTVYRAAISFARENSRDPVVDWLDSLEWDGEQRLDDWLSGWCNAPETSYTRRVGRMWMIGCVARAMMPGCKNDTVLVLQGETGMRKSTALEVLGGKWFAELTDEKDMLQKIHGPWIVELPELGPFRTLNYNRIKSFTSTRVDRFRAPYMRNAEDRPRSCSLAVTLNPEGLGWQEDPTSARRFWPVNVGKIDLESIRAAREQLWAEAVVAFRAGETWWVEDPRDPEFMTEQASIYAVDTWEATFERVLREGGNSYAAGGRQIKLDKNPSEFELVDLLGVAFGGDARISKWDQQRAARSLIRLGYISAGRTWKKAVDLPPVGAIQTEDGDTEDDPGEDSGGA